MTREQYIKRRDRIGYIGIFGCLVALVSLVVHMAGRLTQSDSASALLGSVFGLGMVAGIAALVLLIQLKGSWARNQPDA